MDYKDKYLKYRTKYLELKSNNMIGGGNKILDIDHVMFPVYNNNDFLKEVANEYNKNKDLIDSYLKGDSIENLGDGEIMGLSLGVFVSILFIIVLFWAWSLKFVIDNWTRLGPAAKIASIFSLSGVFGGPIGTFIIVLVSRDQKF